VISYGRQSLSEADIAEVVRVLRSDIITQGPVLERFEQALAAYCGARFAIAVSSGTAALHLACLALGLGPQGLLWTSPNTFLASANCSLYCGAGVDFVDIDPRTYNLDVGQLESRLRAAQTRGRLPSVLVPVHFGGQPCHMQTIRELGQTYGFAVIEDACHALGARYGTHIVGSCAHSDATVFSFHPVKSITTGEGGMVVTNSSVVAERVRMLRNHGVTRDPDMMEAIPDGPWYYEQIGLGYNYRMTDFQAALGLSQLGRLEELVMRRNQLTDRYDRLLAGLPLDAPYRSPGIRSACHLYVVRLRLGEIRSSKREVFEHLRAAGFNLQVHYRPVHLQPYYRRMGFAPGRFPEAERHYAEALTLPLYPGLSDEEQDSVVSALREALGH